jgi:polyphosphate kinase
MTTVASTLASKFINREISWLDFNLRVLEEAQDDSIPLLERLKFLAITGSNLDEFFMVRVGSLQQLVAEGSVKRDPTGLSPSRQLKAIRKRTAKIVTDQYECYLDQLEPLLGENGLKRIQSWNASDEQIKVLDRIFNEEILSIFTPQRVTSKDDFPLLIGLSLSILVQLGPDKKHDGEHESNPPRFAVVPFGPTSRRFITLPSDGGYTYMLLEDVIEMYIQRFFPGEEVVACAPFRITRNADLELREDLAADLMSEMQAVLDQRKLSNCVRLEVSDHVTTLMRVFLQDALEVDNCDVVSLPGPLDLASFMQVTSATGMDHLRYDSWSSHASPLIDSTRSMFEAIAERDLVLYHPFESFDPVVRFISEAADDKDVVAIKQTLYRTSNDSEIVAALMRAADKGKNVTVVVELKARFDEQRNIEWARHMEQAGVQVFYGVKGLKTHAKICIVVRREPGGFRRYLHFGTGNYNETTARFYTDSSLMTCSAGLGDDAVNFFNAITGYSQPQKYSHLEAAPIGLRNKLLEMINVERERCASGHKGLVRAKMNSLVDPQTIDALYAASQVGVKVELIVRGICCLRPGVPGLSDNITVVSIIDRLLEHSRILYCYHGGDERVFISSADWMPRNLDRRVELLVPVEDEECRQRLIEVLEIGLADNTKARQLLSDGTYVRPQLAADKRPQRSQEILHNLAKDRAAQANRSFTGFEPHKSPHN